MAYDEQRYSAVATAAGAATITIKSGGQRWTVQQVSTEAIAAQLGSTCALRKNGALITTLVSTGDVAAGVPYPVIGANDVMTCTWAGLTVGQLCQAFVIYDDGNKS
jgi:hypothetical protein